MNRNVILRAKFFSLFAGFAMAAAPWSAARAQPFIFSTGNPDGRLAMACRPPSVGVVEVEPGDDFSLAERTIIESATFTGLIAAGAALNSINYVGVEIYRFFPLDSNTTRVIQVPGRTGSPADITFDSRNTEQSSLTYTTVLVNPQFNAANSIINGINPAPNHNTQGEGPVSGQAVTISVTFNPPLELLAGRYFFVPQVRLYDGEFLCLSAARPIVAPGTPVSPDFQVWIRNGTLAPDWLRAGTDIIGGSPAPTFNLTFSLNGRSVCYANCDLSTIAPAVNINDFVCFQYRYAAGEAYANCDGSTIVPVLNVNDFTCFLNKFASGCVNP